MHICSSCGEMILENKKHLGICPKCSRNSLKEIVVICPICHRRLTNGSIVAVDTVGWICSHPKFDVKIYLELRDENINSDDDEEQY